VETAILAPRTTAAATASAVRRLSWPGNAAMPTYIQPISNLYPTYIQPISNLYPTSQRNEWRMTVMNRHGRPCEIPHLTGDYVEKC
jgi:hypothetical protein